MEVKKTLKDAPMAVHICLWCIGFRYEITISFMTIKTTKKTGENQKFRRKVQEERVEAI